MRCLTFSSQSPSFTLTFISLWIYHRTKTMNTDNPITILRSRDGSVHSSVSSSRRCLSSLIRAQDVPPLPFPSSCYLKSPDCVRSIFTSSEHTRVHGSHVSFAEQVQQLPLRHQSCRTAPRVAPAPQHSRKFELGDVATTHDMHVEKNAQKAHEIIASLPIHSFAFILRSNGEWTYAIIANRPVETGHHASIRWVVDEDGSTKTIKSKHWSKFVRLVKETTPQIEEDKELAKLASFHRAARRIHMSSSRANN